MNIKPSKIKSPTLILIGIPAAVLATLLGLSILIHPWVIAGILSMARPVKGMDFVQVEVEGYKSLNFHNLTFSGSGITAEVRELTAPLPLGWWQAEKGDVVFRARQWTISGGRSKEGENRPEDTRTIRETFQFVLNVFSYLRDYLPGAVLEAGTINLFSQPLKLSRIVWDGEALHADGQWRDQSFGFSMERVRPEILHLDGSSNESHVSLTAKLAESGSGLNSSLEFTREGGEAHGKARWKGGWLPTSVSVEVKQPFSFQVDKDAIVRISRGHLHWESEPDGSTFKTGLQAGGSFHWSTAANGSQRESNWQIDIEGGRYDNSWKILNARLTAPFVKTSIDQPIILTSEGLNLKEQVTGDFEWNGEAFPWYGATGHYEGRFTAIPDAGENERAVALQITGSADLPHLSSLGTLELMAETIIRPAAIDLRTIELSGHGKKLIHVSGVFLPPSKEWQQIEIEADLNADILSRWMANLPPSAHLAMRMEASGSIRNPDYGGTITFSGFAGGPVPPIAGNMEFNGHGLDEAKLSGSVSRGPQSLSFKTMVTETEDAVHSLILERLQWSGLSPNGTSLQLADPVEIHYRGSSGEVLIESFSMHSEDGKPSLQLDAPLRWSFDSGPENLQLSMNDIRVDWLDPWIEQALPMVKLSALSISLNQSSQEPWWSGDFKAEGVYHNGESDLPFSFGMELNEEFLRWHDASVAGLLRTTGELPLKVGWSVGTLQWEWQKRDALKLSMVVDETHKLPSWLETIGGVAVQDFSGRLNVEGSLNDPRANLELRAAKIDITALPLPVELEPLHDVDVAIEVDQRSMDLGESHLRYGETTLTTIEGGLEEVQWRKVLNEPSVALLEELRGHIRVKKFPVGPIASFFPATLDRPGVIDLSLDFTPGGLIEGVANMRGAALHPWPNGAVVREIECDLRFSGRKIEIIKAQAELSGKQVEIGGSGEFASWDDPDFDLVVQSQEVDLVRSESLILRAGLDLKLVKSGRSPVSLTGDVSLQNSLWLQDLTDFADRGPSSAGTSSPPYFQVSTEPFASWEVDIDIKGENFLQMRSTVVKGRISADFDLEGNLGHPLLSGQATVDDETFINFPFGRLKVENGRAEITEAKPLELQIQVLANGNSFGYELVMQMEGTASEPAIELTSLPPLPQDQILLMLTTGAQPSMENTDNIAARGGRLAYYVGQDLFGKLLGKEGGSRIRIHSGDSLSQFGETTTAVEYRMNEDYSIIGEYDEFGDYNLNLKWRVYEVGGENNN